MYYIWIYNIYFECHDKILSEIYNNHEKALAYEFYKVIISYMSF